MIDYYNIERIAKGLPAEQAEAILELVEYAKQLECMVSDLEEDLDELENGPHCADIAALIAAGVVK